MSKEKRVKERAAWRELQIVIRNYRALGMISNRIFKKKVATYISIIQGFDYLIKRPSDHPVCFGSTIEREACTLDNNKMNALMRRIVLKPFVNTFKSSSPILKKVCATQLRFLVIRTECLWNHPLSA